MRATSQDQDGGGAARGDGAGALSVRQIAHELNSLLDGSLRHLRLARARLSDGQLGAAQDGTDEAAASLDRVAEALTDMAEIIRRAASSSAAEEQGNGGSRTIGEALTRTMRLLAPLAEAGGVEVTTWVSPQCRDVPAGPLGPVILNGLRNAIEACSAEELPLRRVEASVVFTSAASEISIIICDSGHGIPHLPRTEASSKGDGHGIGLSVCRDILAQLGGGVELTNIPFGGGAVFLARAPLESLLRHE